MSKKSRYALLACSMLAMSAAVLLALVFFALRQVPAFYAAAVRLDVAQQTDDSHEFLVATTALASNAHRQGRWQVEITAAQINGWLAVDRVENHPDLLAPEIVDPRVAIEPGLAKLAFRYDDGHLSTVVSLEFDVTVPQPNVVALRIHAARAGALPIPLGEVLETVTASASEAGTVVRWLETDGDPTAWITLPATDGEDELLFQLDTIQLRDGALFLAGDTKQANADGQSELSKSGDHRGADRRSNDQPAGSSIQVR